MSDKNINDLLFIFKKDQKGNFAILYVSDNLADCIERHKNEINCPRLSKFFPGLENKVFDKILNSITKKTPLKLPLVIDTNKFIWVNLEGFICPTEDNGLIINALLKPRPHPKNEALWIYWESSGNLFSNLFNGPNYHFKSLEALEKTLKINTSFKEMSGAQGPIVSRRITTYFYEITLKTAYIRRGSPRGKDIIKIPQIMTPQFF
jgi:hypothetical protein